MLEIKNVTKIYEVGELKTTALDEVSLRFRPGEFVAILGPSGCGKTTMLNIIGGLDRYTSGDLIINGKSTKQFKDSDWDSYRNNSVGFVFQSYNLINHISILENVEMGMTLSGVSPKERREKALEVLKRVGLEDQVHKRSSQLSGGQKQRAAIARALVNDPDVMLADEPTGALDTTTSREVMELIREIAKEKLVIMVTHNREIAEEFATRLVKLRDGKVIEANEPDALHDENDNYQQVKTSMSFWTALKLSFNNLKTKFGRTIITAFAGSIGIIGVALVLAISNGFGSELDSLETETLSTLPITISEVPMVFQQGPPDSFGNEEDVTSTVFDPVYASESVAHYNVFTDEYLDYINNIDESYVSSVQYNYGVSLLMMTKNSDDEIITSASSDVRFNEFSNNQAYIDGQFDLVEGALPINQFGVVLVVDSTNKIDANILNFLGFDTDENIEFSDVIGEVIVVANADDISYSVMGMEIIQEVDETTYTNGAHLTVTGILRAKSDGLESDTSGIYYHDDLELAYIQSNINSDTCTLLLATNTDDLNPDEISTLKFQQHTNGCLETPLLISVYPASFETKDEVVNYLDDYNTDLDEEDQILYTDLASLISGIMGTVITSISTVLVAFAAISLVVSSIMIGIITYISVLERTKEIGILRSLGARKKDISRVFNAESFIVGLLAGILGVVITLILSIPINIILENLLDGFENVASLRIDHGLYLILISVALTFIAGLIPSRMAAKKDPVEALRHNE